MNFSDRFVALLRLFLASACVIALPIANVAGQNTLDVDLAKRHVDVLTSDSMRGRGYLLAGHRLAADYIREEFRTIGVVPVVPDYFQYFNVEADLFPVAPTAALGTSRSKQNLRLGYDFLPLAGCASGRFEDARAIDARFGLTIPEYDIDDFANLDVAGRVVVVKDGAPDSLKGLADIDQAYSSTEQKAERASSVGAIGLVVLVDRLTYGLSSRNAPIPVIEVLSTPGTGSIESVSLSVQSAPDLNITTQNVVGRIPGTGATDSTIVLVAHYDHKGAIGEALHFPGANDNASGVALLLDMASYTWENRLRDDLILIAFSGEEEGLLGSKFFVENVTIDLSRVRLVVNLDMVASAENGVLVFGGVEHETAFGILEQIAQRLDTPISKRRISPNSDHYWFARAGVPSIYMLTNGGRQPYHHVEDLPETLEWDDYAIVREMVRRFLASL